MSQNKRVTRSDHRVICGVVGGVADYLGLDRTLLRIIFVALAIFPGHLIAGILVYLLLMVLIPGGQNNHSGQTGSKQTANQRKTLQDVTEEDHE